jgi:hypothetical protein
MASSKTSVTSRTNQTQKLEQYLERSSIKGRLEKIKKSEGKTEEAYFRNAAWLKAMRKDVEAHKEYWGITWEQFARRHVRIEKNRRAILMKLMDAKDLETQDAIVRRFLDSQNERAERWRMNRQKEVERAARRERRMSERQKSLLAWVRKASTVQIDRVWLCINRL